MGIDLADTIYTSFNDYLKDIPKLSSSSFKILTESLTKILVSLECDDLFKLLIRHLKVLNRLDIVISNQFRIEPGWIPNTVKVLDLSVRLDRFTSSFKEDEILVPGSLPLSVIDLKIDIRLYRRDPIKIIPQSVTNLVIRSFTTNFNGDPNLVPSTVTRVEIGGPLYSLKPGYFQNTLTEICFFDIGGLAINEVQPGIFPDSLKTLYLDTSKKLVPNSIPQSVKSLTLGQKYNHMLNPRIFPTQLNSLVKFLKFEENIFVPCSIPETVSPFSIKEYKIDKSPYFFSPKEYATWFETEGRSLPFEFFPSMEYLKCSFTRVIKNQFPESLKTLVFDNDIFSIELGSIPPSVTSITFSKMIYVNIVAGMLPPNLKELNFRGLFTKYQSLPVIPPTVTKLYLTGKWMKKGKFYDTPPFNLIPISVQHLELSKDFECTFKKGVLPSNLKTLIINRIDKIEFIDIPNSIETLVINSPKSGEIYKLRYDLLELIPKLFSSQPDSQRLELPKISVPITTNFKILSESLVRISVFLDRDDLFKSLIQHLKVLNRLEIIIMDQFRIEPDWIPNTVSVIEMSLRLDKFTKEFKEHDTLTVGSLPLSLEDLVIDVRLYMHNPLIIPPSVFKLHIISLTPTFSNAPNLIPPQISHLTITGELNELKPGFFPSTLKEIIFNDFLSIDRTVQLQPFTFPESITSLRLDTPKQLVCGSIPKSVKYLNLDMEWNQEIIPHLFLPDGLKLLNLGQNFTQFIKPLSLPNGLETLVLKGRSQLFVLDHSIPSTVTKLVFPRLLNPIPSSYLTKLQGLNIDPNSIANLHNILPDSITSLETQTISPNFIVPVTTEHLKCSFSVIANNLLPPGLKTLILEQEVTFIEFGAIPPSVTSITFTKPIRANITTGILPHNLKELNFMGGYQQFQLLPVIPPTVTKLCLAGKWMAKGIFNETPPFGLIPDSVQHLELSQDFVGSLKNGVLPSNLKTLIINSFEKIDSVYLPNSIETLIITHPFNKNNDFKDL
eukprot:gene9025-11057_t